MQWTGRKRDAEQTNREQGACSALRRVVTIDEDDQIEELVVHPERAKPPTAKQQRREARGLRFPPPSCCISPPLLNKQPAPLPLDTCYLLPR